MNRYMKTFSRCQVSTLFGLIILAGQSSATVLCGVTDTNPKGDVAAPFPTTTVLTATFSTTVANQLVAIKHNAVCSIGVGPGNGLNSDIVIDPAGAPAPFLCPPSNGTNPLCSGNHTATQNDGYISAVTNCLARIQTTGVHRVTVQVTPLPGAAWFIDDQSLICEN